MFEQFSSEGKMEFNSKAFDGWHKITFESKIQWDFQKCTDIYQQQIM